jgi:hypothetical protein
LESTAASTKDFEDEMLRYYRQAKVWSFFIKLMNAVMERSPDSDYLFWHGDVNIEVVRTQLGIHHWEDVKHLSRDDVMACLHTMDLKRYQENNYFIGLWQLPPEGTPNAWVEDNSSHVGLKTGKGSATVHMLRKRLANYLGLPSGNSQSPQASSWTTEELERELASRQTTDDGEDDAPAAG